MEVSHDVGVLSLRSCSPQDTEAIGAALAPVLRAGDVVLLVGELGSGKTALTRGLARALGSADPVTSPTFTIMRHHDTDPFTFIHMDAYRLTGPNDVEDLGLLELLDHGAVAVIEWGDIVADGLGPDHLDVRFAWVDESERTLDVVPVGRRWSEDGENVRLALALWEIATSC